MSHTPKFKVVDEYGITHHIGKRSECETYKANAYTLFGGRFKVLPIGSLSPSYTS